ncbi:hypothetical protein [Runella sp.]|uniref:hypothetical protein n=1 Tax=Runella sp. TaxID=1960881 RepID=UPI003D0ACD1E
MKNTVTALLIVLAVGQQACRTSSDMDVTKPAIKSISFAGIPDKDVTLDALNHTITVRLPSVLEEGLKPTLRLTDDAQILRGLTSTNTVDLTSFCSCTKNNYTEEPGLAIGNTTTTVNYRLVILPPKGALKALASTAPLRFSRQTKLLSMNLPVENLYTNPHISTIEFTNSATGTSTRIQADGACLNACKSDAPNQLIINLSTPIERDLLPGTYSIAISTANGVVTFPQRLIVTE